jgi:hypothetical protein
MANNHPSGHRRALRAGVGSIRIADSFASSNPNLTRRGLPMRRPIFKAGVWTVVGLAIAFAVVSANSNHRRAVTTASPAAKATVATAALPR